MNLEVLNKVSTDGLLALKARVETILASRLDNTLRIGRRATFKDGEGDERILVIERVNGKSVSGVEDGKSLRPGTKWRVSKAMLTVLPEERKTPLPTAPVTPYKPASADGAHW